MQLSAEQTEFVTTVKDLWSRGLTQQEVADSLRKPLSTVRSRLRYYGFRFGRGGILVPIHAPVLEQTEQVA